MDSQGVTKAFLIAAEGMLSHTKELCLLDSGIGDGDHGITIQRGYEAAISTLTQGMPFPTTAAALSAAGEAMGSAMGGAIGPVYAMYWEGAATALGDGELTADNIAPVLNGAVEQVMLICGAKAGEKTAVDAMLPAAKAASGGSGLGQCLETASQAAAEGAEATVNMIAKKGRARFLREKSQGHMDAGARSYSLFLSYFAAAVTAEEQANQ